MHGFLYGRLRGCSVHTDFNWQDIQQGILFIVCDSGLETIAT